MSTNTFWRTLWFRWLLAIAASFVVLEGVSIFEAVGAGQPFDMWTLSDTVRGWSTEYRWLAPVAIGLFAGLAWHFFGQKNRA